MLQTDSQFFSATDVGRKRAHNEDNFLVDATLGLYVVADGMGGHAAGEVASAIAVHSVHDVLQRHRHILEMRLKPALEGEATVGDREVLALLEFAVQAASARVHSEAQKDKAKRGMGTTMSLILVLGSQGYVAHVGDSRVYLWRNAQLRQVTEDHTVANELARMGKVLPENLVNVPQKNAITRAVCVYEHVDVDTLTVELLAGDEFLLCSDGLSGYFDDTDYVLDSFLTDDAGNDVVRSLIGFANEQGGKDNITAVLLRLGRSEDADAGRARTVRLKRDFLSSLPLFERLNEPQLLRVMQVAKVCQFDREAVVVDEGDAGDQMFVVLEGKVCVTKGNTVVSELGPGEQFGEMALIRRLPRSATVTAVQASKLISFERKDFFELLRSEERIAVKLLWQLLLEATERLESTTAALRGARDELEAEDVTDFVIETDDPFRRAPSTMALGGFAMGMQGEALGAADTERPRQLQIPPAARTAQSGFRSSSLRPPTMRQASEAGPNDAESLRAESTGGELAQSGEDQTIEWQSSQHTSMASPVPPAAAKGKASPDATLRSAVVPARRGQRSTSETLPRGKGARDKAQEQANPPFLATRTTLPLDNQHKQLDEVREAIRKIKSEQAEDSELGAESESSSK
jgi:PPM family protein phosphatase